MAIFTKEQIVVMDQAISKLEQDVKTGKNLDTLKARSVLMMPTLNDLLNKFDEEKKLADSLKTEVPENSKTTVRYLTKLKSR